MPRLPIWANSALKSFIHRTFPFWEKWGIHITPSQYEVFYYPIPVVSELSPSIWQRETPMLGIDMNEEMQLAFLNQICSVYQPEYDRFGLDKPEGDCVYFMRNGMFGDIDGDVLYSMIRHFKPQHIIEIGSGWSTVLAAYALHKNTTETGRQANLTAIEPYPSSFLKQHVPNDVTIIDKPVQEVGFEIFEALGENDILFIDSSHVAKIDSDVCFEFLEVLPRLKKGVLIHIHDIFLPFEYPQAWVRQELRFWTEAYILQAFLMFNQTFEILWAGNWMKIKHPEQISRVFRGNASQSFWIRKVM